MTKDKFISLFEEPRHAIAIIVGVVSLIFLTIMFAYQTDTRYHKPPVSKITQSELNFEKRVWTPDIEIAARRMELITIGDGFTINNYTDQPLDGSAFSCKVDGVENVFEWGSLRAFATDGEPVIQPNTGVIPRELVQRYETREQYLELKTSDLVILSQNNMVWLLQHSKVMDCKTFTADFATVNQQ